MVSHSEVINNYFNAYDREHYNRGANVFFENNTLYSYGTHFILAQKCNNGYILNGDGYSSSTAKHQSIVRGQISRKYAPIIPFSALEQIFNPRLSAPEEITQITIIDVQEDTYEPYTAYDKEGKPYEAKRHHLGASLIKYNKSFYLSGIDAGSKNYNSYYLVKLKGIIHNVKEAFRSLANNLNDAEYEQYLNGEILRQGEYFFVPTKYTTKELISQKKFWDSVKNPKIKHGVDLSKGRGNAHISKDNITIETDIFVKRSIRHTQHKMISLKNIWHKVIKNTALKSWAASGNVD